MLAQENKKKPYILSKKRYGSKLLLKSYIESQYLKLIKAK